jgi:hypothetical protein
MRLSLLLLLLLIAPGAARAEWVRPHADLVCAADGNRALARFAQWSEGDMPDFDSLPAAVDGGLSATATGKRRDCVLANGWEIRLRLGEKPYLLSGQGAAEPPAFFSLWIDRRKIFSRRIWTEQNYSRTEIPILGLVITPTQLTICERHLSRKEPVCRSEPLDLAAHAVDAAEYPATALPASRPGALAVVGGTDPDGLCRRVIKRGGYYDEMTTDDPDFAIPEADYEWLDTNEAKPEGWLRGVQTRAIFGIGDEYLSVNFPNGRTDFDGDGKPDTVVQPSNGGIVIVAPGSLTVREVLEKMYSWQGTGRQDMIDFLRQQGWQVYASNREGLYPIDWRGNVRIDPFEYLQTTYLLVSAQLEDMEPSAILLRPRPQGEFEKVCVFQRPRLNY